MLRRLLPVLAAIALLPATPVAAQEIDAAADQAIREGARKFFPTDPLSVEEEARMPAARALADLILPPGAYAKVMANSLQTTMRPLLQLAALSSVDTTFVQEQLGLSDEQWRPLPPKTKLEVASLLDPAFGQRARAGFAALSEVFEPTYAEVEPSMRQAIAEIHAQRFTEAQMAEIGTFFATPTGAIYAEQWLGTLFDPRMSAVTMEIGPRMIPFMMQAQERMKTVMDGLGKRGQYADLPDAERDRVAELLGMDRAALDKMARCHQW